MATQSYDRQETLEISNISINGEEVTGFCAGLNIYEDIFSHYMTCELGLLDPVSLTELIPIQGGEIIDVTFRSQPSGEFEEFTKTFMVYSLTNMSVDSQAIGEKGRLYLLHGISQEAILSYYFRISRPYAGKECGIVADVCENILGITNLRIDPCKYEKEIVVPGWMPTRFIEHCTRTAIRENGYDACNYIFYEDMDQYNFVSLDYLLEQPPLGEKITARIARHVSNEKYAKMNASHYINDKNFDLIENMTKGMYGTRFYGINLFEKYVEEHDYVYSAEFPEQVKIDGNNLPLMISPPSFPEQQIMIGPNEQFLGLESHSRKTHEWANKHRAMKQQYKNNIYTVDIDGNSSLRVGQIVDFDLPSYDSSEDFKGNMKQELDEFLSGKYVIAFLRHYISLKEHRMLIGLIKPQYLNGISG